MRRGEGESGVRQGFGLALRENESTWAIPAHPPIAAAAAAGGRKELGSGAARVGGWGGHTAPGCRWRGTRDPPAPERGGDTQAGQPVERQLRVRAVLSCSVHHQIMTAPSPGVSTALAAGPFGLCLLRWPDARHHGEEEILFIVK